MSRVYNTRDTPPLRPVFVCRRPEHCAEVPCEACGPRRSGPACAGARAVGKAVMTDLPAAGVAAGRRLAVRVMEGRMSFPEWQALWRLPECILGYGRAPR